MGCTCSASHGCEMLVGATDTLSRHLRPTILCRMTQQHALVTDPPYYDAVPYAYLSDFFYVWLRRSLADVHPELFRAAVRSKG